MESGRLLNLNWNNFGENLSEAVKEIKDDVAFHDVTLMTPDGNLTQANKFILSICSSFFKGLFKKTASAPLVVYLKGVSSIDLENILNFIYYGEANVGEEDLSTFLETAKDLEIKGLIDHKERPNIKQEKNMNEYSSGLLVIDESNIALDQSLDDLAETPLQISKVVSSAGQSRVRAEKTGNVLGSQFICNICGKSFSYKHVLQNHRETHQDNTYNCKGRFTSIHSLLYNLQKILGSVKFWASFFFGGELNENRHFQDL